MLEDIRLVHLIMSKFALVKTTFFFIHLKKMIFFFFGGIIKKKGTEKNPSWLSVLFDDGTQVNVDFQKNQTQDRRHFF